MKFEKIPLHQRGKYGPLEMGNIRGGIPFCRFLTNPRQPSADTPFGQTPVRFAATPFGNGAVGALTATVASQSTLRAARARSPLQCRRKLRNREFDEIVCELFTRC
jgi:hypothetical protein